MQYAAYIMAAYLVTFAILGWVFVGSYRKYKKLQSKFQDGNHVTGTEPAKPD